jgi:general secretion pathway protein D
MLELILSHNGIGVKKINSYARQLYIFKQDPASIKAIANRIEDLQWVPAQTRLFYVFSPPLEQLKGVFQFFERFSDPKLTNVYLMGNKVIFVSFKEEIEKLLALYNAVWETGKGKISRVVSASKMSVKDMEKILHAFFGEIGERIRPGPPVGRMEPEGLTSIVLPDGGGLVLIGQKEVVERAEKMIKETENQLEDPSEMTVFWYTCKHSDPSEVAEVLEKIYTSLIATGTTSGKEEPSKPSNQPPPLRPPLEKLMKDDNTSQLVVNPPPAQAGLLPKNDKVVNSNHFIPYPKTGLILMVIRRDALDRIKEILRKIDIPKKMVQIEVLLFEKKLESENNFGLNLLRIGSAAENVKKTSATFNNVQHDHGIRGLFQFLMSRKKHPGMPAFDLAYNFLMTQDNIRINAAPSVITVNQTPATISIVDEISINNGASPVQTSNGQLFFEKSFTRAQYGITIVITPTIHIPDSEQDDDKAFVTLEADITFDTPKLRADNERPDVPRRHIVTEVRVVDGQTLILGGLRRKLAEDSSEKVPFLGELPLLGKLFGISRSKEQLTEMFIFITPRVIVDPEEDIEKLKMEELKRRPGDLPEFLIKLKRAREKQCKTLFENSFKLIFGSENDGW